jgi:hypothetical protein
MKTYPLFIGHGFDPHRAQNKILPSNKGVSCRGPWLGHVVPFHSLTNMPRVNSGLVHVKKCTFSLSCHHLSSQPTMSPFHVICMVVQTVRTVQSAILSVWKNGQNTISPSYELCLSPFKLHWDHEDEIYAMNPLSSNF